MIIPARRSPLAFLLAAMLVACHRPTEIRGLYVSQARSGTLFPCDDPQLALDVPDLLLAARYRSVAKVSEPVYVRLRGIKGHSGSPKGSSRYYFQVQQILELRSRASGECPGVAQPLTRVVP